MVTPEESLRIIEECLGNNREFLGLKNHKKSKLKKNTYQLTLNLMSIDVLFSLMEKDEIKNVFFHPSSPPPGTHIDSIASRYRIYIEYYNEK
tara:strand:- start:466 stop:741 length:276 start_codon:yes stop_codon:yes gene_type:complete